MGQEIQINPDLSFGKGDHNLLLAICKFFCFVFSYFLTNLHGGTFLISLFLCLFF